MNYLAVTFIACGLLYSALCVGFDTIQKESRADAARQEAAVNQIINLSGASPSLP
jgi:hypothetical protein